MNDPENLVGSVRLSVPPLSTFVHLCGGGMLCESAEVSRSQPKSAEVTRGVHASDGGLYLAVVAGGGSAMASGRRRPGAGLQEAEAAAGEAGIARGGGRASCGIGGCLEVRPAKRGRPCSDKPSAETVQRRARRSKRFESLLSWMPTCPIAACLLLVLLRWSKLPSRTQWPSL